MNILAISLFLRHATALFYKDSEQTTISDGDVIFKSSDIPSAISCAHKCLFLDKQSEMSFYQDVCTCIKRSEGGLDDADAKRSVSGLFLKPIEITTNKNSGVESVEKENIALNKSATQSSTYGGLDKNAEYRANDGNLNTRSATDFQNDPWWQVDLGRSVTIKVIRLHLHKYAFEQNRYEKFEIKTRKSGEQRWQVCEYIEKPVKLFIETDCSQETTARYVRISVGIYANLYLPEVEIFE